MVWTLALIPALTRARPLARPCGPSALPNSFHRFPIGSSLPGEKENHSPRLWNVVRLDWPDNRSPAGNLAMACPLRGERKQVKEVAKIKSRNSTGKLSGEASRGWRQRFHPELDRNNNGLNARPHPGLLPRGEGESLAAALNVVRLDWPDNFRQPEIFAGMSSPWGEISPKQNSRIEPLNLLRVARHSVRAVCLDAEARPHGVTRPTRMFMGKQAGEVVNTNESVSVDGAINLFRRRGDADAMDEVGGHDYFSDSSFKRIVFRN